MAGGAKKFSNGVHGHEDEATDDGERYHSIGLFDEPCRRPSAAVGVFKQIGHYVHLHWYTQDSSQNDKAWALDYTRAQCGLRSFL